jgi:hypothetical protein
MRFRGVVVAMSLMFAFVSGCSSPPPVLPDRANPAVKAEEARLARVIGADPDFVEGPGLCKVRLLGQKAAASFVWADCTAIAPVEPGAAEHTAASGPLRVDGAKVTRPGHGISPECPALYDVFPKDLADFVCKDGYSGEN